MTDKAYLGQPILERLDGVLDEINLTDTLAKELVELKAVIENLRNQVKNTRPEDIARVHVPSATDELDAIVGTTEQATVTIMECCESVLNNLQEIDKNLYHAIETDIIRIYEACIFQDLTGQRVKKVVTSLKQIDNKIASVLTALDGEVQEHPKEIQKNDLFLSGPALPQEAVSQSDIDSLLSGLDTKTSL